VFYRSLKEKEAFMEILGLKDKSWENVKFLPEQSIVGDLRSSTLALKLPSQGMSALALAHIRRGSITV
jgi:hypothetical protein